MSQGANTARLTNTSVNIVGSPDTTITNYGPSSIAVTGNNFNISSPLTLTLGSTGNVTIGNTGSGAITRFNAPITLGPAPTASGQLGFKLAGAIATPSSTPIQSNGTSITISSIELPIGTWLLVGTYLPNITSTPASINSVSLNLSTVTNAVQYIHGYTAQNTVLTTPSSSTISTTGIYTATATQTMYLVLTMLYTGGSITIGTGSLYFLYTATRIG